MGCSSLCAAVGKRCEWERKVDDDEERKDGVESSDRVDRQLTAVSATMGDGKRRKRERVGRKGGGAKRNKQRAKTRTARDADTTGHLKTHYADVAVAAAVDSKQA